MNEDLSKLDWSGCCATNDNRNQCSEKYCVIFPICRIKIPYSQQTTQPVQKESEDVLNKSSSCSGELVEVKTVDINNQVNYFHNKFKDEGKYVAKRFIKEIINELENNQQKKKDKGTLSNSLSGVTKQVSELIRKDDTRLQNERSASSSVDNHSVDNSPHKISVYADRPDESPLVEDTNIQRCGKIIGYRIKCGDETGALCEECEKKNK